MDKGKNLRTKNLLFEGGKKIENPEKILADVKDCVKKGNYGSARRYYIYLEKYDEYKIDALFQLGIIESNMGH